MTLEAITLAPPLRRHTRRLPQGRRSRNERMYLMWPLWDLFAGRVLGNARLYNIDPEVAGLLGQHLHVEFGLRPLHARQMPYRWQRRGLTESEADAVAVSLGMHPCAIWPTWFDDVDFGPRETP